MKLTLATLCLLALGACASLGVPQARSFNQKFAVGISTVTTTRQTALTLLTARKITADDAQNVQDQADNARQGLEIARTLHASLPEQGDAKIDAALLGLKGLTAYLCSRDPSQPLCAGTKP